MLLRNIRAEIPLPSPKGKARSTVTQANGAAHPMAAALRAHGQAMPSRHGDRPAVVALPPLRRHPHIAPNLAATLARLQAVEGLAFLVIR
jgi:hypothetical protein